MEEKTKKRGWVKDAAIIFLAILLILTFFSSTILNRSLPEVATEYVKDGTITSKVRGTGTVVAKENYDVTIDQSHKVKSVLVKVGQEVAAGDTLMILEAGESTELEMAMETLANLEEQYQRKLINSSSSSDYAREDRNIKKARETLEELQEKLAEAVIPAEDTAEYEAAYAEAEALIEKLEADIEAQQKRIDAAQAEIDVLAASAKDVVWDKKLVVAEKQSVVDAAQAGVDEKQAVVDAAQAIVDAKQAIVDAKQEIVDEKKEILSSCKAEYEKQRNDLPSNGGNSTALETANAALRSAENANEEAMRKLETQRVIHGDAYDELEAEAVAAMNAAGGTDIRVYLPAAAQNYAPGTPKYDAYQAISTAKKACMDAAETLDKAQSNYQDELRKYNKESANNAKYRAALAELEKAEAAMDAAQDVVDAAQKEVDAAAKDVKTANKDVTAAKKELESANKVLAAANEELTAAKAEVAAAQSSLGAIQSGDEFSLDRETAVLVAKKSDLTAEKNELDKQLTEAKTDADKLKTDMEKREADYKSAKAAVENQQNSLDDLIFNLEQQKKNDGVSAQLEALDRQKLLDQIEKQKAEIAELTSEDEGTEVKSLVAGTVQTISVSAGHEAKAGAVLATIEVPDLGYTLNFSVTNDQARRLKVGDTTTVSNFYWGSQINATLTAIKTDPQNPQGSKQLTFDVTGDVTAGSSLTLSIGEKNANYDMVVPNSAIRSDVNGSFVLKITAKNSPLGNRYFASRVNVEVIASDEKYSAISGAIEAYDSVITTASRNAPIEAGDQVRLADSNA